MSNERPPSIGEVPGNKLDAGRSCSGSHCSFLRSSLSIWPWLLQIKLEFTSYVGTGQQTDASVRHVIGRVGNCGHSAQIDRIATAAKALTTILETVITHRSRIKIRTPMLNRQQLLQPLPPIDAECRPSILAYHSAQRRT